MLYSFELSDALNGSHTSQDLRLGLILKQKVNGLVYTVELWQTLKKSVESVEVI